jgi:competence protein ComGC
VEKPFIKKKNKRRGFGCITGLIVLIVYFAGLFLLSIVIPNFLQHKKTEKVQAKFYRTKLIRQLEKEVKKIPISDIDKNLKIYRKLAALDPQNLEYKEKIASYTKQKESWINKTINGLVLEYKGKIVSIEKLDDITCWAILNSDLSHSDGLQLSENIGYYIKNTTGYEPSVHVFQGRTHIAVARPTILGDKYEAKLDIKKR